MDTWKMSANRTPRGVRQLVCYSALGIGFGQPEGPVVAIVAMNPQCLWTTLL